MKRIMKVKGEKNSEWKNNKKKIERGKIYVQEIMKTRKEKKGKTYQKKEY